jgi:iron(III) transport system permease protein
VYPVEIFIQFSAYYDEKAAAILSYPLILITVIGVLLLKWFMGGRAFINLGDSQDRPPDYDLGKYRPAALGFCCAVIGLSVLLPLYSLAKTAGSPDTYVRVLTTSWEQIGFSLIIAVMGGMATIVLAFPMSHMIERSPQKHVGLLELASLVPFAIPAITLGIGVIKIWNRAGIDLIYNSIFIIVLGYVARFIPFAIRLTSAGLKKVNPGLEEAAELSTGNWLRVMRKIVLPLCSPSLLAGFFITFVLSLGELGTTLLVIPPGRETLPLKIYNLMHYGAEQMVAALSLILVCMILVAAGGFAFAYKLMRR